MILSSFAEMGWVLVFGLLLGVKHAFEADHIVAVSTIASRQKSFLASSRIGAFWGMGHTATIILVGFVVLLLRVSIPEKVAVGFEFAVGIMLAFLGASALNGVMRERTHSHLHAHGSSVHKHAHLKGHHNTQKSFLIGMVHGLAGSAALMLLVLASIKSVPTAILYMMLFGIGSIVGMTIITGVMSAPFIFSGKFEKADFVIRATAGIASISLGALIISATGKILV